MKKVGYYGYPEPGLLELWQRRLGGELLDLDIDMGSPEAGLVPKAYCRIITNIVNNAMALRDKLGVIVASVGEEKCCQGRFAAWLLKDLGFRVVESRYLEGRRREVTIATSTLPLREKVLRIMDTVHTPNRESFPRSRPTVGFWGVPPSDLAILDLFPDSTHVFGWTRCVEAGVPADLELECKVEPGVRTVFFSQAFCAKQALARHLAEKHRGLYIDADRNLTTSIAARIEAFIRLG
ncbi:MAG: hypothetical protein ACE5LX_04945 [Nitrospinota bacterium]